MPRRGGKHVLSAEDRALWAKIQATTRPLEGRQTGLTDNLKSTPDDDRKGPAIKSKPPASTRVRVEQPASNMRNVQPAVAMDKKTFVRLQRGKLEIESRLDLHGLTLEHAHPRVISFVLQAKATQKRLILIITGKGRARGGMDVMPAEHGILRRYLPIWLSQAPLKQHVLQVSTAHPRHGGEGAYYVYLRRER